MDSITTELPPRFHLAIPMVDPEATRRFYSEILGSREGRSAARWIDFNFFGHQLSFHLVEQMEPSATNPVDGELVPARHFGLILPLKNWKNLRVRLEEHEVKFVIQPTVRFEGNVGEQHTLFIRDPNGNVLEFKAFKDPEDIWKKSPSLQT